MNMKYRRNLFSIVALAACFTLALTVAVGQDPLNRGKGGGSSSGGSSQGRSERQKGGHESGGDQGSRGGGGSKGGGGSQSGGGSSSGGDQGSRGGGGSKGGGGSSGGSTGGGTTRREDPPLNRGGGSKGNGGSGSGGLGSGSTGSGSSGGQSSGGLGRGGGNGRIDGGPIVVNPPANQNRDNLLGKKNGRSGNVNYGSNSNQRNRDRNGGPVAIDRAPIDLNRGSLGNQVRRSDEIRVGNLRIRFGYTHYDSRWCDDYFYYPHYVFDPYASNWACSPWYYYASLPPYFLSSRCNFSTVYWSPFSGNRYRWNPPTQNSWNRDYSELDYVIQDIVLAFEEGDRRAVGRLVPRYGQVGIIIDGRYDYGMRSDDFYDTFLDAVDNTRTRDYQILDVQYRRDSAAVWARHEYEDPWGRRVSVYHYFKLETEGRNWVIREFGTSNSRW